MLLPFRQEKLRNFPCEGDSYIILLQMDFQQFLLIIGCGATITRSTGFIASPNYPEKYLPNLRCAYKVRLPSGKRIKMTLMKVDIEKGGDRCTCLLYTSPSPRDKRQSRMPSSA